MADTDEYMEYLRGWNTLDPHKIVDGKPTPLTAEEYAEMNQYQDRLEKLNAVPQNPPFDNEEGDPGPEPRYYHFATADGIDELNRYSKLGYFFVAVVTGELVVPQFLVKKHCTDTTYKNDDDRLFK